MKCRFCNQEITLEEPHTCEEYKEFIRKIFEEDEEAKSPL